MAETTIAVDEIAKDVFKQDTPEFEEKEVADTKIVFVPFDDFEGRINQDDYQFRKDVPVKISKAEANIWIEGRKGYIK